MAYATFGTLRWGAYARTLCEQPRRIRPRSHTRFQCSHCYLPQGYLYPDTDPTGKVRGLSTPAPHELNPIVCDTLEKSPGSHAMKIFPILLSGALLMSWGHPLLAQDAECFIEDSKGRRLDLGEICGKKAPPPTVVAPKPQLIRVPIKSRRGNTPIIEVTFNGNQTFDMILDTGATGTVITQEMATALKVKPAATIKAQVADGSIVMFPVGFVDSIAVNGAVVNRLPVAIAPQIPLGLLGNDFLSGYDVKIKRDTIELYQRN